MPSMTEQRRRIHGGDELASSDIYTASAFMRMKLGSSLSSRQGAAHLFETQSEAIEFCVAGRKSWLPKADRKQRGCQYRHH